MITNTTQMAVFCAGGRSPSTSPVSPDALGVPGVWRPWDGFEAFAEELASASAASDARQAQQRREHLAVKYRLSYPADLVPAVKGEARPEADRRAAAIRLARRGPDWTCAAMAMGLARCARPGKGGRERCQDRRDE
jgi:hypothetical protein